MSDENDYDDSDIEMSDPEEDLQLENRLYMISEKRQIEIYDLLYAETELEKQLAEVRSRRYEKCVQLKKIEQIFVDMLEGVPVNQPLDQQAIVELREIRKLVKSINEHNKISRYRFNKRRRFNPNNNWKNKSLRYTINPRHNARQRQSTSAIRETESWRKTNDGVEYQSESYQLYRN